MIYCPNGLMRYNDSIAIVDDIPLLSQWIKKPRSEERGFLVQMFLTNLNFTLKIRLMAHIFPRTFAYIVPL